MKCIYYGSQGDKDLSYLKFSLGSIPSNVTIINATLYTYQYHCLEQYHYIQCYNVSDDTWTETSINWNNRPPRDKLQDQVLVAGNGWKEYDLTWWVTHEHKGDGLASVQLRVDCTKSAGSAYSLHYTKEKGVDFSPYVIVYYMSASTQGAETKNIVPDPSFESNRKKLRDIASFDYTGDGAPGIAEIYTMDSYTGRQSVKLEAYQWDHSRVYTAINSGENFSSITSVTFWYKHLAGSASHSPYAMLAINIEGGPYDGDLLVLFSWDLPVFASVWTLYDNDDWHYLVLDGTTGAQLINDFDDTTGISGYNLAGFHHALASIQEIFDGTFRHNADVAIAVGLWSYSNTTTVLVDNIAVNV